MNLHKSAVFTLVGGCCLMFSSVFATRAAEEEAGVSSARSLQLLLAGNQRFVTGKSQHDHQTAAYRTKLAKGQHPFAVIVGCSDSRVPPEIVFDQGLGDLFGVRTAGQVMSDSALGSMEYAVEHLDTHLILVLGHAKCGAVDAATKGGHAPGHIDSLVKAIAPAVKSVKGQPGSLLENAVKANVGMVVSQLRTSHPILSQRIKEGKLSIVGAYYDLESGRVTIVPVSESAVRKWQHASH